MSGAPGLLEPAGTSPDAALDLCGGAHHTGFSLALTPEHLEDFATMAGLKFLLVDGDPNLLQCRNELRWNDAAYGVLAGR